MNRFRDRVMRGVYDGAVAAFEARALTLFLANGERRRSGCYGSGIANAFWHGFDGVAADRQDKATPAYALWRAGQDCKRQLDTGTASPISETTC